MTTPVRISKLLLSLSLFSGSVSACDVLLDEGLPLPTEGSGQSEPANPDAPSGSTHWVFTDDLDNARDLGGVPLANGATSAYGVVFRGPPLALSADGCNEFAALGIRTLIDLRSAPERAASPDAACARSSASVVQAPLTSSWDYNDYLTSKPAAQAVIRTFEVLADPEAYPVYIHCSLGRDRSGVMSALILGVLGATRPDIVKEYNLSRESVGAYPMLLDAALDTIDSAGGTEAFLDQTGVTAEQTQSLRAAGIAD